MGNREREKSRTRSGRLTRNIRRIIDENPANVVWIQNGKIERVHEQFAQYLPDEEILAMKPKNAPKELTDLDWLITVRVKGYAEAYGEVFMEAVITDRKNKPNLTPSEWSKHFFGNAGEEAGKAGKGNYRKFVEHLGSALHSPDELGYFGRWFQETGLHERFMRPVMLAFLND